VSVAQRDKSREAFLLVLLLAGCGGTVVVDPAPPTLGPPALPLPRHRPDVKASLENGPPVRSLPEPVGPSAEPEPSGPYGLPYEPVDIMSGWDDVRGRGRRHHAIDFTGMGPDGGLGTPIRAIGRSRVVRIGRPQSEPDLFGRPLRGGGTTTRAGRRLPRSFEVEGYGRVYFFTRNYGSWRSGAVVVTELLDGPLTGHTVRYMHLGAVHPDLETGDVLDRGEEIGLMGGTSVQRAMPHLHIDCSDADENRVDLTPYLLIDDWDPTSGPTCRLDRSKARGSRFEVRCSRVEAQR
jgi:hypothetical protein